MSSTLEDNLSSALRAIEELIELRNRMLDRARDQQLSALTATLEGELAELQERATALRQLLLNWRTEIAKPKPARRRTINGEKAS